MEIQKFTQQKKNIFWDFDGVLMDSMPVRNRGFELVLKEFPSEEVAQLMEFHLANGGLSRYVKFRHFFEEIRNESISETDVSKWASKFSEVMRKELLDTTLLISDSLDFVKSNKDLFSMHIVSGSDQAELRYLCEKLNISTYFLSINGSPTPKKQLVTKLLEEYKYKKAETVLIGDSINDFEAAEYNEIDFIGYNNKNLKKLKSAYVDRFSEIDERTLFLKN